MSNLAAIGGPLAFEPVVFYRSMTLADCAGVMGCTVEHAERVIRLWALAAEMDPQTVLRNIGLKGRAALRIDPRTFSAFWNDWQPSQMAKARQMVDTVSCANGDDDGKKEQATERRRGARVQKRRTIGVAVAAGQG